MILEIEKENKMEARNQIAYQEYLNRENEVFHAPYEDEFRFYHAVRQGNLSQVEELLDEEPLHQKQGMGTLSKSHLQSLKYHFAISAAMVARYCIEGGMAHETAYLLSDYYIAKADLCGSGEQLSVLLREMMSDYTGRMAELRLKGAYTKKIRQCVEYIYKNLHMPIRLTELAQITGMNASQLSKQFKKEVGMPVSSYILARKLETARNMLLYSEYSISEIAAVFAFSSQSHFTQTFRKYYGETPLQCRQRGAGCAQMPGNDYDKKPERENSAL